MSLSIKEIDKGISILSSKILSFISSNEKVSKKSLIHFIKNSNNCHALTKKGDICGKKVKIHEEICCKIHSKTKEKSPIKEPEKKVVKEVVEKYKRYCPIRITEGLLKNYFILDVAGNNFLTDTNYVYGLFLSNDKQPKELEEKYKKILKDNKIPLEYKIYK